MRHELGGIRGGESPLGFREKPVILCPWAGSEEAYKERWIRSVSTKNLTCFNLKIPLADHLSFCSPSLSFSRSPSASPFLAYPSPASPFAASTPPPCVYADTSAHGRFPQIRSSRILEVDNHVSSPSVALQKLFGSPSTRSEDKQIEE